MRIRATVAAASGALALSALFVLTAPAAHAGEAVKPDSALPVISKVSVNGGKDTVLGTTAPKTITLSVTASHASGIVDGWVLLWHGTDLDEGLDGVLVPAGGVTCKNTNVATTATCSVGLTIDPRTDLRKNKLAGTWHVLTGVTAKDGSSTYYDSYATARVQRLSKLTVNAAPEPVRKSGTITVTGKLSRANWEDHAYHGYTGQSVKLQFRKKTSSTYTTVKTIRTNSTGNLKTTVKASVDGYWRYSFAGTSTTPAVTTAGDFVDVK
ncbi:calcium-binding protein [Streptomyces sp. NPDC048473]|uniref:calcium-binding protein n=1 Tax=unclassified Streptomyces TaxID=2593676 RepID=UPI0037109A77